MRVGVQLLHCLAAQKIFPVLRYKDGPGGLWGVLTGRSKMGESEGGLYRLAQFLLSGLGTCKQQESKG